MKILQPTLASLVHSRSTIVRFSLFILLAIIISATGVFANEATTTDNWSDPNTWGGSVPSEGSTVVIPQGVNVFVDVPSINVDSITVPMNAALTFNDQDTTVRSRYISVMGTMTVGTEQQPISSNINFIFYGDNTSLNDVAHNGHEHGTKGLYVMGSGVLDIHGDTSALSWTRLNQHAEVGSNQITVVDNTNWQVGDLIVIASTDFDAHQAETATIVAINGTTITLDRNLQYFHFGQTQTFGDRVVENRAEVGLLSRNIVLQGEIGTNTTFGAHTMFMRGTTIRIEGLELVNVGQEGILGRYPLHFHLAQDMSTSYLRENSIHQAFNRGITIHGTDNTYVQDNVLYDVIGHSVFLEDAVEQGNTIERNLVILTRRPNSPLIPSDTGAFGPASYWLSNPNNFIRDNVAAGSEGTGFWYDLQESPTGSSSDVQMEPRRLPLPEFSGNITHSNHMIGMFIEPYHPYENQTMTNITAYKNRAHGAWVTSNGQLFGGGYIIIEDSAFLDNGTGVLVAGAGRVRNSIYVGLSDNGQSTEQLWHSERPLLGHRFYDGPAGVENVIFYNYQPTSDYQAGAFGWRHNIAEGRFMGNHVENIQFVNANQAYFIHSSSRGELDTDISYESMVFEDHDGSFGGQPYSVISTGFPLAWDDNDTFVPEWNGYIVNNTVGLFRIACNGATCPTTIIRDDGARAEIGNDGRFNASMSRYYEIYRNDTSCNLEVSLVHEYVGDWALFGLPYTCDLNNMQDANDALVAGNSYNDVLASPDGTVYYYDTNENMLYFKLVQPRDNEFEVELVNRYFDYVRVFGSGSNTIVSPPDTPDVPDTPTSLDLDPISLTTTVDSNVYVDVPAENAGHSLDLTTLSVHTQPTWGEVIMLDADNGVLAYVPDGVSTGISNFAYEICDTAGTCGVGAVAVSVETSDASPPDTPIDSNATVSGDLMQWHRVSLTFDGPDVSETNASTFWDYRLLVTFTNGQSTYTVPGFFAADGDAANTGATSGNKWRVHFTPDAIGEWSYTVSFRTGNRISISLDPNAGSPTGFDGETGTFSVTASTAPETDFRYHGMLNYVGTHHLQFAGSGEYYLKAGADSPENFLGYSGFDGTFDTGGVISNFLHSYTPHINDWQAGDPTWGSDQRGQGIIGALNYLSSQGVNSYYFITYNIDGGDGADTWPWTDPNARETFDISKLDQWEIVFAHMTARGIQLHFLTQETENDGELGGNGNLNDIRMLYYREMVARFAHHPALQWNIGEENSNGPQQQRDFAAYFRALDPYNHPITIHSNYNAAPFLYNGLFGDPSYEATSIQGDADNYNAWAIDFRNQSANAGRPWAIYGDEQGPQVASNLGNLDELRRDALWGNLMGGGAGVEWYFGYQGDFGDIQSEDFRPVQPLWEDSDHAVDFFQTYLPFWDMSPDNGLVANGWALAKTGDTYAVYLPNGGTTTLNLPNNNTYDVFWYNPRTGGNLQTGSVTQITGSGAQSLGNPPSEANQDWAVLVRLSNNTGGGNTAPTLNAISDRSIQENEEEILTLTANDADGDPISFSLTAPDFVTLQDAGNGTATLTIAPTTGDSDNYLIVVTVQDDAGGSAQDDFTLTVTSEDMSPTGVSVTQFVLIDAPTGTELGVLTDGMTLNLAELPSNQLNVSAITNPSIIGSVVFALNNNSNFRTENVAPYTLAGDSGGGYGSWIPELGNYTLTATPYTESNSTGVTGTALTVNFQVISSDTSVNQAPIISPIPNLTLSLNDPINVAISATDNEGDALTLSSTGLPSFLTFNDNGNGTAQISGSASQTGNFVITVTANDGTNSTNLNFAIVINENDTPQETVSITGFTLIDATTGTLLQALQDGVEIDVATLASDNLAVRAEPSSGLVQEVAFNLNNNPSVDNSNPFTIPVAVGGVTLSATPYQAGSLTAVNTSDYGYDPSRSNVSIPSNAVRLNVGDNVQAIVNANPDGTAFVFSAGIYREVTITPKNGQRFYGEEGAVLSGARVLMNFVQDGNLWYVEGQTQQGRTTGQCLNTAPRCQHPEDLFIDGVPLRHVGSLGEVVSGTWFFDYNADRIYFADNPVGRVIETSVSEYAFGGSASNVLISNLTIEKYASPSQVAAISAVNTTGWVVQNNIIQFNHGGGIQVGNATHAINNYVVNNGQIGISGIGDNIVVEWNDIGRNNYAGYNPGWEAGGTKFVLTNNLMVRHNYVYENYGPGLWTDIDNINSTYDSNLVMNNVGMGIFHEISYDVTISNNVSMYNAVNDSPWLYGGQIVIATSSNASIYNNRVVVSENGGNGITILQQNRGSGELGIRRSWNNNVFNNLVVYLGTVGQSGAAADWEEASFFSQGNNRFDGNIYYANDSSVNHWAWQGNIVWADFQARGQDVNGSVFYNADNSLIAGTPANIQFTLVENTVIDPISAPTNLTAIAVASDQIDLAWSDNANNETMFEVERDGAVVSPLPADSVVYFDTSLTAETAYCYRVRALNDDTASDWTEQVCATTPPQDTGGENQAPTLETPAEQTNNVGDSVTLQLQADDPEDGVLRFTASGLPDGLIIDATTGEITGSPTIGGSSDAIVTVIDDAGLSAEATFTWIINGDDGGSSNTPNSVAALILVNADTNQDIMTLTDGINIDLNALPTRNLNVRARVTDGVESVGFGINQNSNFSTENEAPYALAGDNSGNYNAWSPNTGAYTIVATPYSDNNKGGVAGNSLSISFTISEGSAPPVDPTTVPVDPTTVPVDPTTVPVNPTAVPTNPPSNSGMAVTGFVLVNADTNQDIMPLTDGQTLILNQLPTRNLNIRITTSGSVESVAIRFNNNSYNENVAPYSVHRDNNGNYNAWRPRQGSYTLTATPHARDNGNGAAGTGMTITFRVTNN